jgi:Na+/proline symporter
MLPEPGNKMKSQTATMRKTGIIARLFLLILLIVFGFAIIVLPHIDLKGVKQKIATEASTQLNGEVAISPL